MRVDRRVNQLLAVTKSTEYPAWAAFTPEPDRPVSSDARVVRTGSRFRLSARKFPVSQVGQHIRRSGDGRQRLKSTKVFHLRIAARVPAPAEITGTGTSRRARRS